MMHGSLTLDRGVVSANAGAIGYMDAAKVSNTAGFELALVGASVHIGDDASYRAPISPLTLTVAIHPGRMRELAVLLADKSGMPAFGEGAWRTIAQVLRAVSSDGTYKAAAPPEVLQEWAKRIEEAYGWTP